MVSISNQDKTILRELAKEISEIAALPIQGHRRGLWQSLNSLKPDRPMLLVDQICWNEMNVDDELTLRCENDLCRQYETDLRRKLYCHRHLSTDLVIEPWVVVPKLITGYQAGFADWEGKFDFGIKILQEKRSTDLTNEIVSHAYKCQLFDMDDLEKIKFPRITYMKDKTLKKLTLVQEIFGDSIDVKLEGCYPGFWFFDAIVHWCGVEETLMNMIAEPEFLHALCKRLQEAYLDGLDQLEEQGLLGTSQTHVHCTGAYSEELENSDAPIGSAKRLWTFNLSQIFSSVSPAMHESFEVDYSKEWYERFGFGYYGCCEPLHDRIDMLKKIPNIRKVSVSPFADVERSAEAIGDRYVMSRKPNPCIFAGSSYDTVETYRETRDLISICNKNGTPLEIIQKDVSTLLYKPQRLWQWTEMVYRAITE